MLKRYNVLLLTLRLLLILAFYMSVARAIVLIFLNVIVFESGVGVKYCDHIRCSNVFDPVCGLARLGAVRDVRTYQNICHFTKIRCRLEKAVETMELLPGEDCGIHEETLNSEKYRRVNDFGIVGAAQECNHTCPTFCVDIYEPVCAQVWNEFMNRSYSKPIINHCHVDLFSCAHARNVTILPLTMCYSTLSKQLQFMAHVAAMKSLGLIGDDGGPGGE